MTTGIKIIHHLHQLTGSIAHSAKCRLFFKLLRGRFWGFSPHRGDTLHRWGVKFHPHRWNFYWDLTKMWNINAPQEPIPCAIFTKFAEFVPRIRMRQLLKFRWICSRGYGVMEVLSWRGLVTPKFSAPVSGETVRQTPKVLKVQERAQGPLSPC